MGNGAEQFGTQATTFRWRRLELFTLAAIGLFVVLVSTFMLVLFQAWMDYPMAGLISGFAMVWAARVLAREPRSRLAMVAWSLVGVAGLVGAYTAHIVVPLQRKVQHRAAVSADTAVHAPASTMRR